MSGFSAFVFNLSKSGKNLFISVANGNCLFSLASIVIGRRKLTDTGVYELRGMEAVKFHVKMQHIMPNILHQFMEKANKIPKQVT